MTFFSTEWYTSSQITLLIYLLLLRKCAEWLEENFFLNNGLPDFFIQGKYSYQSKAVAIEEYRETINVAVNSENTSFSQ
jgi:maltodextrin utilization protein YvdJ